MAGEERALALAREEAEVLALALGRPPASPARRRARGSRGLVRSASGKRSRASESARSAESMYVWSLAESAARGQQGALPVVDDPRVVAGREGRSRRAGPRARASRRSEARRCRPRMGSGCGRPRSRDEPVDHGGPKRLLEVEREMGQPQPMGERSGADHRLRRAAASRPVVAPVGPQLERHRDHLGAPLALQQRGDRGVHPAAERHEDALARSGGASASRSPEEASAPARGEGRRRPAPPRGGPAGRGRRAPRIGRLGRSAPPPARARPRPDRRRRPRRRPSRRSPRRRSSPRRPALRRSPARPGPGRRTARRRLRR